MGELKWYKRDPAAALTGMMQLSLEERGAYNTVLDLIYTRDGNLPDDDRFIAGWMMVDVRVWRRIKAVLIGRGKLYIDAGLIRNSRADVEVLRGLGRVLSARDAGIQSGNSRRHKSDHEAKENNDMNGTTVITECERTLELPTTTPREEEKETTHYAFFGRTIRLTGNDLERWRGRYHAIGDIVAELGALDDWLQGQDEKTRRGWFHIVSGSLNKKHQAAMRERNDDQPVIGI